MPGSMGCLQPSVGVGGVGWKSPRAEVFGDLWAARG